MSHLPVYVINLDRRPDRLATIGRDLGRLGLGFERVAAVDARDLSDADRRSSLPFIDRGAVACMKSHAEALRRLLLTSHAAALVLEDDAELASDVPAMCRDVDWWPEGSKAVSLEVPRAGKKLQGWVCGQTPGGRDLRTIVRWNFGAAAYLVNRKAARALVASYERQELHTDRLMFDPRISKMARWLRPVQVVPAAARQREHESDSDLVPWHVPVSRRRWRWYIQRQKSPRWMALSFLWRATGRAKSMHIRYMDSACRLGSGGRWEGRR